MAGEDKLKELLDRFYRRKKERSGWNNDTGEIIITGHTYKDNSIFMVQLAGVETVFEYADGLTDIFKGNVLLYFCGESEPKVCDSQSIAIIVAEELVMRKMMGKRTSCDLDDD
jgi:hypothetical protein